MKKYGLLVFLVIVFFVGNVVFAREVVATTTNGGASTGDVTSTNRDTCDYNLSCRYLHDVDGARQNNTDDVYATLTIGCANASNKTFSSCNKKYKTDIFVKEVYDTSETDDYDLNVTNKSKVFGTVDSNSTYYTRTNSSFVCPKQLFYSWAGRGANIYVGYTKAVGCPDNAKCYQLKYSESVCHKSGSSGNAKAETKQSINSDITANNQKIEDQIYGDKTSTENRDLVKDIKNEKQEVDDLKISENDELQCEAVLGDEVVDLLKGGVLLLSVAGVILLIILMSMDFVKAVASSEEGSVAKAWKNSIKRIVATIILLLLPAIVGFVINVINDSFSKDQNGNIKIGKISDCKIVNN